MPMIVADGCPIHVEVEGPHGAPVLMLCDSLGTTLHMWDGQVARFTRHFRLVRYDRHGHGKSGCPKGPYTMERLGRDALAILEGLALERVNWCGLSMGGMVGQWLAANAPERIERLVITNTLSYFPDKAAWNERLRLVREKGINALARAAAEVTLRSQTQLELHPPRAARNSCGAVPVCLRKKRAKWEGPEKARSAAMSWIARLVNTSSRFASVRMRCRIKCPAVTPAARRT